MLAIVVRTKNVHHLLWHDWGTSIVEYRNGFDFADNENEIASALSPENALAKAIDWEPVRALSPDTSENQYEWVRAACEGENGSMLCIVNRRQENFADSEQSDIVRRNSDGTFTSVNYSKQNFSRDPNSSVFLAFDPKTQCSYRLCSNRWGLESIRRISADQVEQPHVVRYGLENEYLTRWLGLLIVVTLAYLLHFTLSISSVAFLGKRANRLDYTFGNQSAVIASMWRRSIAKAIDLGLAAGAFCLFLFFSFVDLLDSERDLDSIGLANNLNDLESSLLDGTGFGGTGFSFSFDQILENVLLLSREFPEVFLVSMFAIGLICTLYFFVQSRYGITPGKWLCGIRTVRTTLRPPGIARLIARDVLLWLDVPFLLSPLPAVISMVFSEQRQRLGDRVADTVVILRKSGEFDSY